MPFGSADGSVSVVPVPSPACASLLADVAERIVPQCEEIARDIGELLVSRITELGERPDLAEDLPALVLGSVTLVTAMARSWTDPSVVTPPQGSLLWARSLAGHGLPVETLTRVYRLGQARYQVWWHQELVASGAASEVILEALQVITAFIFAWVDAILGPLVDAHREESERRLRSVDALRSAELDRILSGAPTDVQASGARLGYELTGSHVGVILWLDSDTDETRQRALEPLLTEVAELLLVRHRRRPLVSRVSPGLVRGWIAGTLADFDREGLEALLRPSRARLAVGTAGRSVDGFRRTAREAVRAQRVARLLRPDTTVTYFADVAVADLLTRDVEAAREFSAAALGPLGADTENARQALASLRLFFEEGQSFARAARRANVHESTVAYRVRRAAELAGHADVNSWALRAAVELAPLIATDPAARNAAG